MGLIKVLSPLITCSALAMGGLTYSLNREVTPTVQKYNNARASLRTFKYRKKEMTGGVEYIPSGLEEDFEKVFGENSNKDKIESLEKLIEATKKDLDSMDDNEDVKDYLSINPWAFAWFLLIPAGFFGSLYMEKREYTSRIQKKI